LGKVVILHNSLNAVKQLLNGGGNRFIPQYFYQGKGKATVRVALLVFYFFGWLYIAAALIINAPFSSGGVGSEASFTSRMSPGKSGFQNFYSSP
jgi:hypothetical protein